MKVVKFLRAHSIDTTIIAGVLALLVLVSALWGPETAVAAVVKTWGWFRLISF